MVGIELLVLFLSSLGLINIICYSPIMDWFRRMVVMVFQTFDLDDTGKYLIKCPTCIGFWVGILMTIVWFNGLIWFTLPLSVSFIGLLGGNYWFPME